MSRVSFETSIPIKKVSELKEFFIILLLQNGEHCQQVQYMTVKEEFFVLANYQSESNQWSTPPVIYTDNDTIILYYCYYQGE